MPSCVCSSLEASVLGEYHVCWVSTVVYASVGPPGNVMCCSPSSLTSWYSHWPSPGVGCRAAACAALFSCAAAAGETANGSDRPASPPPPPKLSTPTSDATPAAATATLTVTQ